MGVVGVPPHESPNDRPQPARSSCVVGLSAYRPRSVLGHGWQAVGADARSIGEDAVTLDELVAEWQRRKAEALETGTTAPVAKLADVILRQLQTLDGYPTGRVITTAEASSILSVSEKTVRAWCCRRRFPGANKTSGRNGDWRIPASDVYQLAGVKRKGTKPELMGVS